MNRITTTVAGLSLAFVGISTAFAATINVPGDYATIQDAINASADGDTIQIAAGTYNEYNLNPGGKAITIQGTGFGGTTIDAQQGGTVFVINSGEGSGTVINDLVITGGSEGGILCSNVSAQITNCSITGNTSSSNGAGIHCNYNSPTFTNCTISNNTTSSNGGGLYSFYSNATFTNCIFSGNSAADGGGAYILVDDSNAFSFASCTFQNNTASAQGGGVNGTGGNPSITNCVISGNNAQSGGGIYLITIPGSNEGTSSGTITDCTIENNTATDGGGGIYCYDNSSPAINGCTIENNTAAVDGGGIMINDNCNPTITGCTITGNSTTGSGLGLGGGGIMILNQCRPNITDCTISGNTTAGTPGGGGIYCEDSSPTIRNTTFDAADTIVLDDESTLNPTGACCYDGLCFSITEAECTEVGGTFTAEACSSDTACPTPCSSDVDNDGDIDIQDLLQMLTDWGACP